MMHRGRKLMLSRRKILVSIAAGAALPIMGVACGGQSGSSETGTAVGPAAKPGAGTVIAYLGNHNQQEAQVVTPPMQAFEQKFPGAKVEVTNLTTGYDEKLQAMLAAGTPPDMFRTGG